VIIVGVFWMFSMRDCIPRSVVFSEATFHVRICVFWDVKFVCCVCIGGFMCWGIGWLNPWIGLVHSNLLL
jgi:hypothetical protein